MQFYSREKLLNSILFFASKIKQISITQLMKFLSQLDYEHFKKTGTTVTGLTYYTYPQGDFSKDLNEEIKNMNTDLINYVDIKKIGKGDFDSIIFIPKKKFEEKYFTPRQLEILNNLIYIYKNSSATQMSKASHEKSKPWEITKLQKGMYEEIDFMSVINDPDFKEFIENEKNEKVIIEKALN